MQSVLKLDLVYAAALLGAASIGSMLAWTTPAAAQTADSSRVVLSSIAMVERSVIGADGKEVATLNKPADVTIIPGDRVVFTLRYQNKGALPATGFRATNPMPGPVQFVEAAEEWAEVSVDGGINWGKLSDLLVAAKSAEGTAPTMRAASAEDVTHVRWVFNQAIAPGAEGSLSYRGVVK